VNRVDKDLQGEEELELNYMLENKLFICEPRRAHLEVGEDIGGFKSTLGWWWGEGGGSQDAILRYICYNWAFYLRQTGFGILGSAHRPEEEWVG